MCYRSEKKYKKNRKKYCRKPRKPVIIAPVQRDFHFRCACASQKYLLDFSNIPNPCYDPKDFLRKDCVCCK